MKKQLSSTSFFFGITTFLFAPLVYSQNLAITLEDRNCDRFQEQAVRMAQGDVNVLWVGDSITHFWETNGKDVWDKYYGNRKAMNFGISGDRTGNVLWRIANSPMDKISPKLTILMIGTNNVAHKKPNSEEIHSTSHETVQGIQAIVSELKSQYPKTKILLLEVFPRGESLKDPFCIPVVEINKELESIYGENMVENVQLYNLTDALLSEDGTLSREVAPDLIHPSALGYAIWAKTIEPIVAETLGEQPIKVD